MLGLLGEFGVICVYCSRKEEIGWRRRWGHMKKERKGIRVTCGVL